MMYYSNAETNRRIRATVLRLIAGLAISLGAIFLVFFTLTRQYQNNIAYSSASHITEINLQGKTNIETFLSKDKNVALELAHDIKDGKLSSDSELFTEMEYYKKMWTEDDIYVYTEDGQCLNSGGVVQNNGDASSMATKVLQQGELFNIVQSQTEYAVAVNTDIRISGSKIVAVSVVHNLDTLIGDIGLKSFGGSGHIYLTRQNGVTICQSKDQEVNSSYNILSYFSTGTMQNLSRRSDSIESVMSAGTSGAFLFTPADSGDGSRKYVAITPVRFTDNTLYLFNVVPQSVVNQTMNEYSRNISVFALIVILLTVLIFVVFFLIYLKRTRRFEADIRSRERLFDLLVAETDNAFMLIYEDDSKPAYFSTNFEEIFKEKDVRIRRSGTGYKLAGTYPAEKNDTLTVINEALAKWDGVQEFVSGYIPYTAHMQERYFRLSLHPVASEKGEFVGIIRDVTPEYNREKSLREALTLADSANRAKTRFLSSVSHDIRTPLNAIINMARFLKQNPSDRENADSELNVIIQSSEHLLSLINDVLDMSRIESGKLSFVNSNFDMNDAIEEVCGIIRPLCEAKDQEFAFTQNVLHPQLVGDVLRLNQILINVLNNAVKFTPEHGTVTFSAEELISIKPEEIPFRFTVRDTGIGIPENKIKSIFEPFSRVENEIVHDTEGTGLGLAITKRFIDALGGTIKVVSELGTGSVFTIELTYKASVSCPLPKEEEKTQSQTEQFYGARALLAEDNDVNVMIATKILSQWGITVESAKDGREALEMYSEKPENYYDIIYMDIQMPHMNGYDCVRAVRASGRADSETIPVVAMTANAFAEDVERARAAGMNAHVSKPIDMGELNRITAKFLLRKD
jgi:signal transduction histidine kinase/CheY-like chemotaxis protein